MIILGVQKWFRAFFEVGTRSGRVQLGCKVARLVTQAVQQPNSAIGTPFGPVQTGSRPQNACGNAFGRAFWPPRPIYDLPGPRWEGRFSTPKVDFLTPLSYRPYSSQICQLGPHLDPSRPVPDVKMHAGMLLDAYFDPPDPNMTFLDLGGKVNFRPPKSTFWPLRRTMSRPQEKTQGTMGWTIWSLGTVPVGKPAWFAPVDRC